MYSDPLKQVAIKGMFWTSIEKIVRHSMQFVFGIILARLLSPDDFGIIGMLAIFIAIAQTFTDSGLSNALIQKQNSSNADFSTMFFFNIIVASVFYTALFLLAPFIASFYREPLLTDVTRIISISILLSALSTVQNVRLTKDLRFKEQSIISISSTIVSGVVGVILACRGWSVWALVFQAIANQGVSTICIWITSKWVPNLTISKKSFSEIWSFGSKLLGSSLINSIYTNIYAFVIGKKFTPLDVGYFNCANQYAELPAQTIQDIVIKVNYPILAKIQDDNNELLKAYRKLLRLPLFILYPILIGMAVLAEPLITTIIGEKWLPCVPVMQIICIGALFSPLTHINLNLLYVKGRTDLVLKLEFIKKPIAFALLFALLPFGILPLAIGKALYEFIAFSINCYYTRQILGYGEIAQLKELLPILAKASFMGVLVHAFSNYFTNPLLTISICTVTGAVIYILLSAITHDESWVDLKTVVSQKLKRK